MVGDFLPPQLRPRMIMESSCRQIQARDPQARALTAAAARTGSLVRPRGRSTTCSPGSVSVASPRHSVPACPRECPTEEGGVLLAKKARSRRCWRWNPRGNLNS